MKSPPRTWNGKIALVTGASSGIGRAVSRELVGLGMKVVGAARRTDRLRELQIELGEENFKGVGVDLRSETSILELFGTVRQRHGGVDVLVNNAGLGHKATLMNGETEAWREMLDVNVLALCICSREAITDMRDRGDNGHIVHISSMSGHRVPGGSGVYSATKFAVRALTEGLRKELRGATSKIRVSAVSPGYVETEFAEKYHQSKEAAEQTYSQFPVLQSEDIADAVRFVLQAPDHMQVHDMLIRPTEQVS